MADRHKYTDERRDDMLTTIAQIIEMASDHQGNRIAVAAAHDEDVIKAIISGRNMNIVEPLLIGDEVKIRYILKFLGETPESYQIFPAENDADSAAKAVALVREGRAGILMKGILSTDALMRSVLNSETGIRTGDLISHIMMYETEFYSKLLFLTDGGVNTYPDLEGKAHILENAARVLRALGYDRIHASCVCGSEVVDSKIKSTLDAYDLSRMKNRWEPYGMSVLGPVGLDMALSIEACLHKNYKGEGIGDADILLMPNYEMGNGIGKAFTLCGAKNAGIVIGAGVPIILVSRSDSALSKLASIALGCVLSKTNIW